MSYTQIVKDLENKIFRPIYLLMGDEPYYIDKISDYIARSILNETEREFNQYVLYGKDADARLVDNTSKRFPMMASHQVVIVKEAQELKDIHDLHHYASNPQPSTILVLCYKYKKLEKNKKLYKAIKKNGVVFESKKLYDNQVPDWVSNEIRNKGFSIAPDASRLLAEFLGNNLNKIANELDKLAIVLKKGSTVTSSDIEKNIGISKDFNVFELQKALGQKDVLKVNRIVNYFAQNPKEHNIIMTITSLFGYFSKVLTVYFVKDKSQNNLASVLQVNPYFVKDYISATKKYPAKKLVQIISLLREYDLKSKGVNSNAEPGALLKELMFKMMH